MSQHVFPWNKPYSAQEDVNRFLDRFKEQLQPNQTQLLEHFRDNIFGFRLDAMDQKATIDVDPKRLNTTATFRFSHLGVEGVITVDF